MTFKIADTGAIKADPFALKIAFVATVKTDDSEETRPEFDVAQLAVNAILCSEADKSWSVKLPPVTNLAEGEKVLIEFTAGQRYEPLFAFDS